jgi:hypothetical protein
MSSTISLAFRRDRSAQYLPSGISQGTDEAPSPRYHPAPSRNEIAFVQPVLVSPGIVLQFFMFLNNIGILVKAVGL